MIPLVAQLSDADLARLTVFRNVASAVRDARQKEAQSGDAQVRMVDGYIEAGSALEQWQALCIAVRRTYLPRDKANFVKACEVVQAVDDTDGRARVSEILQRHDVIRQDLDGASRLNDQRVLHRDIFEAWLDAAVFQEFADKRQTFDELTTQYGKAVEGIGLHITQEMAEQVERLDDLIGELSGPNTPPS